jgi:hypothetical protein
MGDKLLFQSGRTIMIPNGMKSPWWLFPACICCFAGGIFVMLVLLVPEFAPLLHANMVRRGVFILAPLIGGFNIVVPVSVLGYYCRHDRVLEDD